VTVTTTLEETDLTLAMALVASILSLTALDARGATPAGNSPKTAPATVAAR
jgi:hypothetical protein